MSNYCKECFERQEKIDRLEQENKELKEKKDEYYLRTLDYEAKISYLIQAFEEIRNAITESVPKKQGDYNFSKSLNPDKYALLEYIQNKIDEVSNDRD